MENFEKVKAEITNIFLASKYPIDLIHANGTLNWVLKFKPDADDSLKIAAFAHDIERTVNPNPVKAEEMIVGDLATYQLHKREHAMIGAEAIVKILEKFEVGSNDVERVKYLVVNHEDGGDEDANLLRDADSLSFLQDNLSHYLGKYGLERLEAKVNYMLDRMSEDKKSLGMRIYYENLKNVTK